MNFQRNTVESPHKGEVRLCGGFRPAGAGAITALYGNWIQSVTRNGAGDFTVTLKNDFKGLHCTEKHAQLQLSAVADSKIVLGPYSATAGTQQLWVVTGAVAADIAANADNIIWLELVVSYGKIADGSPNRDS